MTNRLALILALLIGAVFLVDLLLFNSAFAVAAMRRLVDLIQLLAFWR